MKSASSVRTRYEDLLELPEDDKRHEIIDGVHYVMGSPVLRHQAISGRLYLVIGNFCAETGVGEVFFAPLDVFFSSYDVVVPDLVFVSRERAAILEERLIHGAPDLVIEILSPSTRRKDRSLKRALYDKFGVGEYWIFDPERDRVEIDRRVEGSLRRIEPALDGRSVLTTSLLPGLEIQLEKIFS